MKALIKKLPNNPILTAENIPYPASLVFNAGVCRYQGRYIMVFRNDFGQNKESFSRLSINPGDKCPFETSLGLATSIDGIHWEVSANPFWHWKTNEIHRVYDPRLTVINEELYICFAIDSVHGIRGGIGRIHFPDRVEVLHISTPDNRNMVLFPEKINGKYIRLERPFTVYSRGGIDRFDIWCGRSPDLRYWGDFELVLAVEDVPFANDKIGPAAPPVKTDKGWLTTFHGVHINKEKNLGGWEKEWYKSYFAGIMLLDIANPTKIIGMLPEPLISPEEPYEKQGFRNHVVFPGGMVQGDKGDIKIFYGAADTVVAMATAQIDDLVNACLLYPFTRK